MLFRAAASVTILACAVNASAQPKPYRLATMPVLGMSLARRDTNGYQPEQTACGDGNTCAEACGSGFEECASSNDSIHCFNPAANQKCCTDGTGNSCEAGYYCTHDTQSQTWCCPDSMDLTECAAAYNVDGGLETPEPSTSEPTSTSAAAPVSTTEVTTTEPATSTSAAPSTTSTPESTVISTESDESTSTFTYTPPASSGFTSAWSSSNGTAPTGLPTPPAEVSETTGGSPAPTFAAPPSGATTNGVSALLLLAAVAVAFL